MGVSPHDVVASAGHPRGVEFSAGDVVRIFEHDSALLEGLDPATAEHLRTRLAVRRAWAEPGPWAPVFREADLAGHLGLLVIEGLLVRTLHLAGRECSEIVGPGDLLRPWEADDGGGSVDHASEWRVLSPACFAVLDARFALTVSRWPTITAHLLSRGTRRCRSAVYQAAIAHVRHAETRVVLALWHLADRWGRVTPAGTVVPVPLTHQLLAHITCLQRPTVSGAIGQLCEAGELSRLSDGGWVLHGDPPPVPAPPVAQLTAA